MKHYTRQVKRLLLQSTLFIFLSSTSIFAQDQGYFTISLDLLTDQSSSSLQPPSTTIKETSRFFTASAEEEPVILTPKGVSEGIPSYYRHHKQLPEDFSGFVIELLQSETKLERNYPLFERYGNVHVKQLEDGKFSYCIITNFKKSNSVKIFAEKIILPHAPQAQALRYKRGKRKKM